MPTLAEVLASDLWVDAGYLGMLPPPVDFTTADELEAERRQVRGERKRQEATDGTQ